MVTRLLGSLVLLSVLVAAVPAWACAQEPSCEDVEKEANELADELAALEASMGTELTEMSMLQWDDLGNAAFCVVTYIPIVGWVGKGAKAGKVAAKVAAAAKKVAAAAKAAAKLEKFAERACAALKVAEATSGGQKAIAAVKKAMDAAKRVKDLAAELELKHIAFGAASVVCIDIIFKG